MSNVIQIKRGESDISKVSLAYGELGHSFYSSSDGLFIGRKNSTGKIENVLVKGNLACLDKREEALTPGQYAEKNPGAYLELKGTAVTGSSSALEPVFTIVPWSNSSGGKPRQFFIDDAAHLYMRRGRSSMTDWGGWHEVLDNINYSSHALPLTGGTLTGKLVINGNANSQPLQVRNIVGSNGSGTPQDLYLQYGNPHRIYLGPKAAYNISEDGSYYSGRAATAAVATVATKANSLDEADLKWGGANFAGSYGCLDAGIVSELGANRFAYADASGITVEYSNNNGQNWLTYPTTNEAKTGLFSYGSEYTIGNRDLSHKATGSDMVRMTLNTSKAKIYTELLKFCIFCTTNGSSGCYCTIDIATEEKPTSYKVIANKVPIQGWSGYNIINVTSFVTYGNQLYQYGRIRFTFGCTSGSSNYSGLKILKIMGFGGVGWTTPSYMAKHGHLYGYDNAQQAWFPSNVYANNHKVVTDDDPRFLKSSQAIIKASGWTWSAPEGLYANTVTEGAQNITSKSKVVLGPHGPWDAQYMGENYITCIANLEKSLHFRALTKPAQDIAIDIIYGG